MDENYFRKLPGTGIWVRIRSVEGVWPLNAQECIVTLRSGDRANSLLPADETIRYLFDPQYPATDNSATIDKPTTAREETAP